MYMCKYQTVIINNITMTDVTLYTVIGFYLARALKVGFITTSCWLVTRWLKDGHHFQISGCQLKFQEATCCFFRLSRKPTANNIDFQVSYWQLLEQLFFCTYKYTLYIVGQFSNHFSWQIEDCQMKKFSLYWDVTSIMKYAENKLSL